MSNSRSDFERVVITQGGMGVVSPLGNSVAEFEKRLFAGECGIKPLTRFDEKEFEWFGEYRDRLPVYVAGQVDEPDLSWVDKKSVARLSRFARYATGAAKQALEDIAFTMEDDPYRAAVIMGNGGGGLEEADEALLKILRTRKNAGRVKVNPLTVPKTMNNAGSGKIAELFSWDVDGKQFKLRGHNYAIASACASSIHSIGLASYLIRWGVLDFAIAGGAEAPITPSCVSGFSSIGALTENKDPYDSCKPFDLNRDGFVMAEGAGAVRLESLSRVVNTYRRREIIAEVVGFGATCDANHDTAPELEGDGAYMAMKLALEDAGIAPGDLGYINAHGTSTLYNDRIETHAIKRLFDGKADKVPPVSSTKSELGHMVGAAGAVGVIAAALALKRGEAPPTINYRAEDPECDLDYVPNESRILPGLEFALVNGFGFGGPNGALVLKKCNF